MAATLALHTELLLEDRKVALDLRAIPVNFEAVLEPALLTEHLWLKVQLADCSLQLFKADLYPIVNYSSSIVSKE